MREKCFTCDNKAVFSLKFRPLIPLARPYDRLDVPVKWSYKEYVLCELCLQRWKQYCKGGNNIKDIKKISQQPVC